MPVGGPPASWRAARMAALPFLAALCAQACASSPPPEWRVRGELAQGRWREAAQAAGEEDDELLRHLDRGLALLYAGDARASNLHLARAEQVAEERYTRSVSRAALSLLVNDRIMPYQADPMERLLVPLYRALNHVASGEREDAAVEGRRLADLLLRRRDEDAEGARREGAAFLAAAAGTLLEWALRPQDARVAYRLALAVDPRSGAWLPRVFDGEPAESEGGTLAPPGLRPAVTSASEAAPLPDSGVGAWSSPPAVVAPEPSGELVLLFETGFVAAPLEDRLLLVLDEDDLALAAKDPAALGDELAKRYLDRGAVHHAHDDDDDVVYLLPIAIPRRPAVPGPRPRVSASVGGHELDVPQALDLSAAAAAAYDRGFAALLAKTAARALVKTLALREATEDADWIVKVLANALHVASERADTRSWGTLPDELRWVRVALPPGEHAVRVQVDGPAGLRTLDLGTATVRPGELTLLHARSF